MNARDYILIIALEKLLEDETLPADLREQTKKILIELFKANAVQFIQTKGV